MALGRSFALEMGSQIPSSDQKLSKISFPKVSALLTLFSGVVKRHGDWNLNTASDFIAQYTNRQEYRHVDTLLYDDDRYLGMHTPHVNSMHIANVKCEVGLGKSNAANLTTRGIEADKALLGSLGSRILEKAAISVEELRCTLRRAAAFLSDMKEDQCDVIHRLVSIPFAIFTKQSITTGISVWLGIVNENPQLESIILVEIANNWENTVRRRMGLFSKKLQ